MDMRFGGLKIWLWHNGAVYHDLFGLFISLLSVSRMGYLYSLNNHYCFSNNLETQKKLQLHYRIQVEAIS